VTGNVGGSVASVAAGGITAGSIAADAIGASEIAADAIAEIADQVWDELLAGHAGVGSAGAALTAAGSAGDPWSTPLPGAYGAGTAGKLLSDAKTDTADILTDTGTTLDGKINGLTAAVITNAAGVDIAADIIALKAVADDVLTDTGTTLPAQVAGLNNISAAQVETAVSNQLNAAIPEPANLSATKSIRNLLYWMKCRFFNRNNQTATEQKTFKDDGLAVLATRVCSDNGTTQELGAGS
jgi:hypothetical protein